MSSTYDGFIAPADWVCSDCQRPMGEHRCRGGFQRVRYKFVAMLRIKNEARWLAEVLESILPLCDRVFVFDDHSTDGSVEICERYFHQGVRVMQSPFVGLDEARDKNYILDEIMRLCEPEWILCVDGDEILEKKGPDIIRETCAANPDCQAYSLQIAFMWDGRDFVRTDRIYGDFWRPSLFRPFVERFDTPDDRKIAQEFRFMSTPFGRHIGSDKPNLHCSSVPQRRIHGRKLCPTRLKHYGYMWREDRVRKLDWYTSIDWLNRSEDCYRHMVQGDDPQMCELPRIQKLLAEGILSKPDVEYITTVPANESFVHAGPLKIERWDEDKPWPVSDWARQAHELAA